MRRSSRPCPAAHPAANAAVALSVILSLGGASAAAVPGPSQAAPPPPMAPGGDTPTAPAPVIRAVLVTGARALPSSVSEGAAAKAAFGKPGTPEVVRAAVEAVVRAYRDRGYPVAEVIGTDLSGDGVLRISVAEGTVRRIVVKGNHRTRKLTILEAMQTHPGVVYREDAAKADRDRLARLGIFSDVVIAPVAPGSVSEKDDDTTDSGKASAPDGGKKEPDAATAGSADTPAGTAPPLGPSRGDQEVQPVRPAAPALVPASGSLPKKATAGETALADEDTVGLVDVVVKVKEERAGNVAATIGYSDGSGLTGFLELSDANFQGAAQQVALQWQRSGNGYYDQDSNFISEKSRQAFDVSFLQPLLGPRSFSYGIDVYNKETVFFPFFASYNDTIRNYETRRGATVRAGKALTDRLAFYLSARNDQVGYDSVPADLNPPLGILATSEATVGALGLNLVLDGRNEADNPHHGFLDSILYERAGSFLGGNRAFSQLRADLREYFALTASPKGPILATRILGGTTYGSNIPLSEYYWLGGYELLRGYDLYSVYGTKMILGSVELRTPLSEGVQGVVFVDTGNAYRPDASSGGLKVGEGIGLRFLSPIGPIRLDVAHGNSSVQTYVSLGQSF